MFETVIYIDPNKKAGGKGGKVHRDNKGENIVTLRTYSIKINGLHNVKEDSIEIRKQ